MQTKKLISKRELRRMYESDSTQCVQHLTESLKSGDLRPENFSIRDLFESLIPDGTELLGMMWRRENRALMEAANAVDTSAFSNITGQLIFNRMKEKYEDPEFIWPQLVDQQQTNFLDGERVPGVGRIGDKAEKVQQGQPYPTTGLNEEFLDTVALDKRGFVVPVTREIIIADRTGLVLRTAGETSYHLGLGLEKRVIDVAVGVTNNYKRNGTALNTYLTSGAYVNSQTKTLQDWTSIEAVELLFAAITDPNTGELISFTPNTIIVPTALKHTLEHILHATSLNKVDLTAAQISYRTQGGNIATMGSYKIITSPQVKARSNNATQWYMGDPKRAFCRFYAWDIENQESGVNSEAWFTSDIWMRFKGSVMDTVNVLEPRYMVRSQT